MDIEKFGIFLAYPPTTDLRKEGLGHYLISFLKGASEISGVRFVVVCPSWSRNALLDLCVANQLDPSLFDIISPEKLPIALEMYLKLFVNKKVRKKNIWAKLVERPYTLYLKFIEHIEGRLLTTESFFTLIVLTPAILLFVLHYLVSFSYVFIKSVLRLTFKKAVSFIGRLGLGKVIRAIKKPKESALVLRLYNTMDANQVSQLVKLCDEQVDVRAWYSPTAFWPEFNLIKKPRLLCVPDVVLSEFPLGFSQVGGARFSQAFDKVERAVLSAEHIVCYSQHIKKVTLIEKYGHSHERVNVIRHAPMNLSEHLPYTGGTQIGQFESFSLKVLNDLFQRGMEAKAPRYESLEHLDYIFYASQFRPNKNVVTLLRAYRKLYEGGQTECKLILSGRKGAYAKIDRYIKKHNLKNQVLCVPGLAMHELAILFKYARLAINPSLSEGGAPFTFTEALSVGTPIVMSRIPVTLEVLIEDSLKELMFFDPYSSDDMARVLAHALSDPDLLLESQIPVFDRLSSRNWVDVVTEHVAILREISYDR